MRILLAGDTYPPDVNGAGVFTQRLVEGLADRGHDVHVVVPSPVSYSYETELKGARMHFAPSRRYPWHETFHIADFRKVSNFVRDVINSVKPEITHVQSHFVVGRIAATASRAQGIPVIATNHFMPENLRYQAPVALPKVVFNAVANSAWSDLARVFRSANVVTAPTPYAVDLLRRRAGIAGAIAVSCGVDIARFHKGGQEQQGPIRTVLFVGRLDFEKHVDQIVDAISRLGPEVRLRVVGTGRQLKHLREYAREQSVADRVDFLGYLSDPDVRAEYRRADVFCMPGTAELQSIATLEAMASGLPVVAASACALPSLVKQSENGALFEPGDVGALARALEYVLGHPARRAQMGDESRRMAERHDIAFTLDTFEAIYQKASQALNH